MIRMGLGSILRILTLAMERVLGNRRGEKALRAIDHRYANAEGAEVDSRYDRHQQAPLGPSCQYISQPRYRVVAS